MRLVNSIALAVFLATSSPTDAFGPAQPLHATSAFGGSVQNNGHSMQMRIGHQDLQRKQRLLQILDANPDKDTVQNVVLSPQTSTMIEKCNWKVRKALLRKVQAQAQRYELDVPAAFGVP